jgi:hypothetical protein
MLVTGYCRDHGRRRSVHRRRDPDCAIADNFAALGKKKFMCTTMTHKFTPPSISRRSPHVATAQHKYATGQPLCFGAPRVLPQQRGKELGFFAPLWSHVDFRPFLPSEMPWQVKHGGSFQSCVSILTVDRPCSHPTARCHFLGIISLAICCRS